MPDSFTANLNLTQCEVGGSFDSWGTKLNADLGLLDAVFLSTGLGTSVGVHVGTGKVANIEGQLQVADSTDTTKRVTFSAANVPTITTIDLAAPAVGGTIATVEVAEAMVNAAHPAGTVLQGYYGATPPSGYIFADGRTIGDATSLATNRANADCERLFLLFWTLGFSVVSGRGASAAADWAAHKQLTLPNHSGRTMAGRDDLSGAAAGILSGYTTVGAVGGTQSDPAQSVAVSVGGSATGSLEFSGTTSNDNAGTFTALGGAGGNVSVSVHQHTYSGGTTGALSVSASGSGATAAVTNVQPTITVDVIIAL